MADFCNQCSDMMGFNRGDMANITKPEDWANKLACLVLYEGCGPIQVDPEGNCVSQGCLCVSQPNHKLL